MALVTWHTHLVIGVTQIDDQHRLLVALVNDLHAAVTEGQPPAAVAGRLERLLDATRAHFGAEEQLMRDVQFPHYADHKGLHELLLRQLADLKQKHDTGQARLTAECGFFLNRWLQDHIMNVDRKVAQHLEETGKRGRP